MSSYPFETTSLTLDEFCFRSSSRKWTPDTKGKGRDVIDAFRTVYWFHWLRIRLGDSARSLRAMEKRLEPAACGISRDGEAYRHNKWRAYKIGKHTPLDSLVSDVDSRQEGAKMAFAHVLWDVLRLDKPVSQFCDGWVQRLEPAVQVLLWTSRKNQTLTGRTRRRKLDKRTLEVLERRAGLDALACLTLLLREANEAGDSDYASELGVRLCRMLLLISVELSSFGIANPLYEFYDCTILPLALHRGLYPAYRAVHFLDLKGRLCDALYHIKGVDVGTLTDEEIRGYKQKILSWNYGWDYFHLFSPVEVPIEPSLMTSEVFCQYWYSQRALRLWAWNGIHSSASERSSPPANLWRAESDARKRFEEFEVKNRHRSVGYDLGDQVRSSGPR